MKRRLTGIMALFTAVILGITAYFYISDRAADAGDIRSGQIVAANEIEQLIRMGQAEKAAQKAAELQQSIRISETGVNSDSRVLLFCALSLILLFSVFAYVYFMILRPFDKMKVFAGKIAQGNFDFPLDFERSNYFGAFTWAFDSMRKEITKARSCEREAIENNKTVIATLSHDIKTPISSIRAYAEGLEANIDSTYEKRRKYLSTIMRKCDEVSKLTDDLFLHSLADLDKLNRNRLLQITENLINNARKYAKSQIDVRVMKKDGNVEIHFRDYGTGIADEDMPFIFNKFYRGKNSSGEQGSGLGLYIVKYITGQMGGTVVLENCEDGLEVTVSLPAVQR